jgi:arylsulfatase A-like enzyme
MAPTSLAWAGLPVPSWMQGRDVFAKNYRKRDAVFAARDRCDETVDRIRSVRTERFKYIRNFHPERPLLQPNAYKDDKAILRRLRELHAGGHLSPLQEQLLFSPTRPAEELYDIQSDPFETQNLAANPAHRKTLESLRARLDRWMKETADQGPESPQMYDSDMAVYLDAKFPERTKIIEQNIALMKRWAREGK